MTPQSLHELKEAAEAATRGDWETFTRPHVMPAKTILGQEFKEHHWTENGIRASWVHPQLKGQPVVVGVGTSEDGPVQWLTDEDARYIALANPATIKALIADYERTMDLLRYAANTIEAMRPSFAQAKDEGHAYHDQVLHEIRQALTQGESA